MEATYDFEPIQLVVPVRKIKRITYFDGLYVFKVRREDLRKQRSQLLGSNFYAARGWFAYPHRLYLGPVVDVKTSSTHILQLTVDCRVSGNRLD